MRRVATVLLMVGFFVLSGFVLWESAQVLLLVFAGILFAVILRTCAVFLSGWTRLSIRWALSLVLVCSVVTVVMSVWFLIPKIASELRAVGENMSVFLGHLTEGVARIPGGSELAAQALRIQNQMVNGVDFWQRFGGFFANSLSVLGGALLVVLIGVFFAYDPRLYCTGVLRLVPLPNRPDARRILMELERILRRWLLVQAISMMFLFLSTWVMLELLGVPLALFLALLTGTMTFVPYMGPIIAIIPILLVSFMDRPILALYAGLLYLVIQNIEENIMMPLLCQKTIHLPAVLTIVGQLAFGGVFGALGFMLATPLMAVGLVLVQKIYIQRFLGDSMARNMKDLVKIK